MKCSFDCRWLLLIVLFFAAFGSSRLLAANRTVEERAIERGRTAAGTLLQSLKGELISAIEKGGPASAVAFCSTRAIPLTNEVEQALQGGISLKRTSSKWRNPANAPNRLEQEVLRIFSEKLEAEEQMPEEFLQTEGAGASTVYHYYRPLVVDGVCLACHGKKAEMPAAVLEAIESRYPDDAAYGYSAGDFRGVVHVTIPHSSLEATP